MTESLATVALHLCNMIVAFNEIDKSKVKEPFLSVQSEDIKREADKLRKELAHVDNAFTNRLFVAESLRLCDLIDEYIKVDQTDTRAAFLGVGKGDLELASNPVRALIATFTSLDTRYG